VIGNIVLDVDGVILLGGDAIEGSGSALHSLCDDGYRLIVATNNATRTPLQAADRIGRICGFRPSPDLVVTSSVAAAGLIGKADQPVLAVAEEGMAETLRLAGIEVTTDPSAAATVMVGLDRGFTYARLAEAASVVMRGARFIATNSDPTFPTPRGPEPGAGSLVAAVASASSTTPEVAGKPHRPMQEAVSRLLGDGPVWMVGDRPDTDLAFAKEAGWRSVLTLSGVTSSADVVPAKWTPDIVIDSLSALPEILRQNR
jgi:4-nitrophenyl phosphatase